jgi:hypothetical protein
VWEEGTQSDKTVLMHQLEAGGEVYGLLERDSLCVSCIHVRQIIVGLSHNVCTFLSGRKFCLFENLV